MEPAALLADLVRFASICGTPNGGIVDYIRTYLAKHGVSGQVIVGPEGDRSNLFATIGPTDRPGYVLSGHMDVVAAEERGWCTDPFILHTDGGRLIGRGAADMKGFLACMLAIVPELVASNLACPIHFALSYDEELGCRGVPHMIRSIGRLCELPLACIVGEPSEMQPVLSHKGKSAVRFGFRGRSGHSSTPTLGLNAIYPAARLAGCIEDLVSRMAQEGPFDEFFAPPCSTLQVGTICGGSAVNIIPEHAILDFEVRTVPNQDSAEIVSLIIREQERLESLSGTEPFHLELSRYPSLSATSSELVALMVELTGRSPRQSVSYGTEAGLFQQAGIVAIICGPGAIERAHQPNEYIHESELADCMSMLRGLAAQLSA